MKDIQTGGGGSVGHDVETKRDFVGRDQYNFPAANMSTDEKLDLLIARVVGDSLRGDTGLVAAVREMSERLQRLEKTMDTQQAKSASDTEYRWRREQEVDGRFNAVFFWIVGAYVVAVLEGLIMIVHILRA